MQKFLDYCEEPSGLLRSPGVAAGDCGAVTMHDWVDPEQIFFDGSAKRSMLGQKLLALAGQNSARWERVLDKLGPEERQIVERGMLDAIDQGYDM